MSAGVGRLLEWLRRPGSRGYLYRIATAGAAVLAGYGILTSEQVAVWVGLGAALLGTGTAAWHTPTTAQRAPRPSGRPAARPGPQPRLPNPGRAEGRRRKFDR